MTWRKFVNSYTNAELFCFYRWGDDDVRDLKNKFFRNSESEQIVWSVRSCFILGGVGEIWERCIIRLYRRPTSYMDDRWMHEEWEVVGVVLELMSEMS